MTDRLKSGWTKYYVRFINWQIRHFTSKDYNRNLAILIRLGTIKLEETKARMVALEAKLADEPGMDPKTGETV